VVSSFFRGVEDDTARTKYEEVFYDTLRKAQQVKGSLSYLEKMTLDERREYVQENYEAIIAITPQLDSIREQVSDLNAAMMKVWMDPDMTPEAKRREVDDIQKDKNELFRDAYPLRPGGKDYPDVSEETLRQFLEDYDVNKLPSELSRRNAPSLGALVQDVLALEDQDTIRVLARGQP
jgi:hypothetical protein